MVKIGIIGSGFGFYGLLPAFNSTKNCHVAGFCGRETKEIINYCQGIALKKIYPSWQEMLQIKGLDAVAIAVPPSEQYKIAKVALKRGLHIFAEKPLAANLKQARELLDLANKKKAIHTIDFIFPEIEAWKKVKELLTEKVYGNLKHISINWNFLSYDIKNKINSWKTDISKGGGALSLYFSHCLYYLENYAGKISDFEGQLTYTRESINGGDVGIDLLLRFSNKITGYAHLYCNTSGLNKHQLVFICEKGTIILENEGSFASNFTVRIYSDGEVKNLQIPKEKDSTEGINERVKIVKKLTTKFIESVVHNKEITPSFVEGVRVQELIEKIRKKAIHINKTPVRH